MQSKLQESELQYVYHGHKVKFFLKWCTEKDIFVTVIVTLLLQPLLILKSLIYYAQTTENLKARG